MAEQKITAEQLSQELHKSNGGRAGGTLLSLFGGTMLFSLCSQSVAVAAGTQTGSSITVGTGNLCEHHPEHDDECGCSEGTTGTACSHENTDDCYTEVLKCVHEHDEDCYPEESIWDDEATPSDADRWEPEYCPPYLR